MLLSEELNCFMMLPMSSYLAKTKMDAILISHMKLIRPSLISLSTTSLSNSVIIGLHRTGPRDEQIDVSSICL